MSAGPVKVLADRIAPMQWSVIEEAIARCSHVSVVAKDVATEDLQDAIDTHSPEVLILSARESIKCTSRFETWLRGTTQKRRIITLHDGLRVIRFNELRLAEESFDGASIDRLSAVIGGRV